MEKNEELVEKIKDPKYYLEHLVKIKGKTPGLKSFILKEAQIDLFNALAEYYRIIIKKVRQIGFSTAVTGWFYHKVITTTGINAALIGYNSDLTAELLDKVKTFYRTTPDELKPTIHYNSKYEISFPRMDSKILVLPSTETVGRGYTLWGCLGGDTKIWMKDNSFKKIKDIIPGDEIVDGNGGYSIVRAVDKKKTKLKMVNISSYGNENLILTEDHMVLARERITGRPLWKQAKELSIGDYLAFPYFQVRNRIKTVRIPEFVNIKYKSRSTNIQREIVISREFGRFVGWYLAEGNSSDNRIALSIHKNEEDVVMEVINAIRPYVSSVIVQRKKDSDGIVITLYGKDFSQFMGSLWGRVSWEKHINQCAWNWGYEFCFGLLEGLINGDGYIKDDRKIQITTVSQKLANAVKRLLVSLRLGLAGVYANDDCYRYGIKSRTRYDIMIFGKGNYKIRKKLGYKLPVYNTFSSRYKLLKSPGANLGAGRWMRGRKYYWSRIKSIGEVDNNRFVYDIGLSDYPHSFLTHAGVVHNCLATELAFWEKAEEKIAVLEASVPIDGKIVIESTPGNVGDAYYRRWMGENDYVKKEYGWWWGYSSDEIKTIERRMNNPRKFAQEFGLQFNSSGRPVFDFNVIQRAREHVLSLGDKISEDSDEVVAIENDLRIYKQPEKDAMYIVGSDVAEGVGGGDYSTAVIFNRRTGEEVAFYRGHIAPDRLGQKLNDWGRKYNNALMVVEINNHGLTTITILKQLLYPSMYFRSVKFEALGVTTTDKMGWKTNKVTRPLLIDDFAQAMRDGIITLHSKEILDEMLTFVHNDDGNMVALEGYYDDCIFAAGIAFQGFKIMYAKPLEQLDYREHLPENYAY